MEVSWVVVVLSIVWTSTIAIGRSVRAKRLSVRPTEYVTLFIDALALIITLSYSLYVPALAVIAMVGALTNPQMKSKTGARKTSYIATGLLIPLGLGTFMLFLFRGTIVLTDDKMLQSSSLGLMQTEREGLKVRGLDSPFLLNNRHYYFWSFYGESRTNPDTPFFSGSDIYIGPHGFCHGDAVAFRVAAWAGTKPTYRRRGENTERPWPRAES